MYGARTTIRRVALFMVAISAISSIFGSWQLSISEKACWNALKSDYLVPIKKSSLQTMLGNSRSTIFQVQCDAFLSRKTDPKDIAKSCQMLGIDKEIYAKNDYIWISEQNIRSLRIELIESEYAFDNDDRIVYEREPQWRSISLFCLNDPALVYVLRYIIENNNQEKNKEKDEW